MTALGNLDELALESPPQRLVSLVPSTTASLFDLGLGARLAGVSDYCLPPAGAAPLTRVGGTKNPNVDQIAALRPELVLANQEENRPADVAALRAAGLKVWVSFPRTVRGALDELWALIRLLEAPWLSPTLDALERSVEWAAQAAQSRRPTPVFCPVWREPATAEGLAAWWMTANAGTYLSDVLALCGGANVFAGRSRRYPLAADLDPACLAADPVGRDTRYPRVTLAEVTAAAPEVILLPSEPYAFGPADAAELADSAPGLPAVAAGRVHCVEGSTLTWPGTRLAQALAELPALLSV